MAVAFKAALNTASSTANKPTGGGGVASGDLLVAYVMTQNANGAITPPSGWTLIGSTAYDGSIVKYAAFWKIAGGSEPATYTWTVSGETYTEVDIVVITGHDPATPINTSNISDLASSTTSTPTMPAITTTVDNCLLSAGCNDWFGIDWSTHVPSGWTLDTGIQVGAATWDMGTFHKSAGAAGSYGGDAVPYSSTINHGVILVAIQPPSTGGAVVVSSTTPHAQWPNPQPARVRASVLRRPHQIRSGVNENDMQHGVLEEFYGDGTQPLLANPHGRWANSPLRTTSRVALTTKSPGYNSSTQGVNDNDLTAGNVDQFYGVIGQPGTQLADATIAVAANSALVESVAQAVSPSGDAEIANSLLGATVQQVLGVATVQSNSVIVETAAQVLEPATIQSNSAIVESAQVVEGSTEQSNSVVLDAPAQLVVPATIQSNSLIVESARIVEPTTEQANSLINSTTQQVVAPATFISNSILIATGGLAGAGGGTIIANSVLVETASQVLSPATALSNSVLGEAGQIRAQGLIVATAALVVTGSVFNPSGVVSGDVTIADAALMSVTINDVPALCTVTLADTAIATATLAAQLAVCTVTLADTALATAQIADMAA